MEDWRSRLKREFPRARFDEPLRLHTTFRIGGPADAYLEVLSLDELRGILRLARDQGLSVFLLGWGSNLLVLDGGLRGLALRLRGDFEKVEFLEGALVRAGAGARVPQLVSLCAERGLAGCEPIVGVPGTVGGALMMNAGTREGEIGALVREVRVLDLAALEESVLKPPRLRFEYRRSSLEGLAILECILELKAGDKVDIIRRVQDHQQRRLRTQPIHTYNVGSIFKNPSGHFVAKLIEDAGLKGLACGGARVSPLHANFIENFKNATAAEVLELIGRIKEAIRKQCGIELELEIKVVGAARV